MVLLESRRRAAAIKHDDGGGLLKTGRKRLQGEPTCFTVTNRFQWKVIGSNGSGAEEVRFEDATNLDLGREEAQMLRK
ncbi:hypothetical protein HUJ04_009590 [Dendroctonus ponderosae]|nr:hypothetical protein HUJ04_009590 [Dendroctonus ponderosae]